MRVWPRTIMLAILVGAAALGTVPGQSTDLTVLGHGQHTEGPTKVLDVGGAKRVVGPLTATFSVGPDHALCSVGEAGGEGAPFNMLVYATEITSRTWGTDAASGLPTFTLRGVSRSITSIGSIILEDALSPFTATAFDSGQDLKGDFFHITIDTSLWPHQTFGKDLDGNPLPLFGGDVAIGRDIADGRS